MLGFYEKRDSFKVIFRNKNLMLSEQVSEQVLKLRNMVIDFCIEPRTAKEIKEFLNVKSRSYISRKIINPLIEKGKLDYTNKNGIQARNKKYITTNKN